MNPTTDVLEQRIAALEGGVAALAVASGQAASAFSVQNLARAGDNIVSSTDLYGGTWNLFANTLKDQGIEARFVDPSDPEAFARATDDRTRAYYAETLPNPKLIAVPDRRGGGDRPQVRHSADHGQHRRADAGAAVRPRRRGGDVLARPNTSAAMAPRSAAWSSTAAISTGRRMPTRQPLLNTPDPSYHGAVWAQAAKPLGPIAYILRMRVVLLRDLGAALSPFNAFLFLQGHRNAAAAHARALPQCARRGEFPGAAARM